MALETVEFPLLLEDPFLCSGFPLSYGGSSCDGCKSRCGRVCFQLYGCYHASTVLRQIIFENAGKKGYIRLVQFMSRCKILYSSCNRGNREDNKESRSPKEEVNDVTTLLSGIFGWKLDTCNSTAWCWQVCHFELLCFCVCVCVCVFAPSVIVYLGNAVSISFPSVDTDSLSIQVRSRCICYILYGKVGASEAHRSHAKSLLGIPPQKTLDEFG